MPREDPRFMRHPAARTALATAAATAAATVAVTLAPGLPLGTARATTGGPQDDRGATPTVEQVTLVTGDVVRVTTGADGRQSVVLQPRPDGTVPQAAINRAHGHLYVVPAEAFGLLADHRLDHDLFDVTTLLEDEYDDASRATLPVMVDYGRGRTAAVEARTASFAGADRTVTIPRLGITAFHTEKQDARAFWADLTAGRDAVGHPTTLADGALRVHLDGRVEATLEDSVPQIHAPEAWAAGFDGTGATVAVLDTGYDPTHPDLAGVVADSANFTTDASVVDGNGHGTHVASTVAGSGAASDGLRTGVAPGAQLLVGKVLSDGGYGEDSWVLAGMVWAVDHDADVVSMSLGGDTDDGTNALAQAVDELSATSDSLFVVAAGNNGDAGPSTVTAPGSAAAALTVGAVDVDDHMASFSGRGPLVRSGTLKPEVVAPGVDVTAARAAGTALGPVVDDAYTTISGTSMATPHVAGLAAILAEQHPAWDGERIKDVIADSAVPVADATGFDAGTGRIDALAAVEQDVVAPASLSLGTFSWPYADLQPTTTALSWTNTGDQPVTLALALASEDGTAEPTGSMSLAADQVTVPAGGTTSVDVVLDPTLAAPGSYSGVVTATPSDGGGTVRTAVYYLLEPERYDVTVTVRPRSDTQVASHQIGLNGFGEPWVYEQRTFDAGPGERTATFRLPPGRYATGAISFGVADDGADQGVVTYDPSFTVTGDTDIVLDEDDTGQFSYDVDRPVVDDGAILDVEWTDGTDVAGYIFYGHVDRVYARPSAGLGGTTTIAANWLLSQPEGVLDAGGAPLALRPLTAPGGSVTRTPVPVVDGTWPVVDAGRADAPDTSAASGAVALVAGTCADLTPAAQALAAAGAAAVVAYAAPGAACAGTVEADLDLPLLEASPWEAAGLLASAPGDAHLATHASPSYMYDLVHFWDAVPDGGTVSGTGDAVATLVEHYRGLGSTSGRRMQAVEELIAWVPARNGVANIGLVRPVPFPGRVTHVISTGSGTRWERTVAIQDSELGGEYARLYAPRRAFAGGSRVADTWFGGVVGSRVSPLTTTTNGAPPPTREGDELFLSMGAWTDDAGHFTNSDMFASEEYDGRIFVDGDLELHQDASVFMNTAIPAGRHDIRVVAEARRHNRFWRLSDRVHTEWTFRSAPPEDAWDVLPMLGVDYGIRLSSTNQAPAGRVGLDVDFTMPRGLPAPTITRHQVAVSWDGGDTWRAVRPQHCGDDSCHLVLHNRAGRHASLRVSATDQAGRTVRQTVLHAYSVQAARP
ncbi:S8 family peptidase [Nocardioides taihuensis]|uniref:S8 family serine peptidase n=1 Tax=Nocardioides taihuensis TaxID=1835606 RepID=A0ABW0BDU2_9ACTN